MSIYEYYVTNLHEFGYMWLHMMSKRAHMINIWLNMANMIALQPGHLCTVLDSRPELLLRLKFPP